MSFVNTIIIAASNIGSEDMTRGHGDLYELYDLVDDPGQTKNLFPEPECQTAKLRLLLET